MFKNQVSIFFSLLFVLFLAAPTVITLVDDSIDVSIFYASTEEEEEKGHEKNIELEILFSNLEHDNLKISSCEGHDSLEYYFKSYSKPHLNIVSPPPDQYRL